MNQTVTFLNSRDADKVFDCDASHYPFGSYILEAVLRYIALKHHTGTLGNIKRIKVREGGYYDGDSGDNFLPDESNDYQLFIFKSKNGSAKPLAISDTNWTSVDAPPFPVAAYLSKHASPTTVYTNPNKHQVMIFVKNATANWIDKFCATLFRILWWLYPETPSGDELRLFKALDKGDEQEFANIINACSEQYDFGEVVKLQLLQNWDTKIWQAQKDQLKIQYDQQAERIRSYESTLGGLYDALSNLTRRITAMDANIPTDGDFAHFFAKHKNLSVYDSGRLNDDYGGVWLRYSITDVIEYFDSEEFKRVYNNPHSYLSPDSVSDEIREIMYDLFALERGHVKTTCVMKLNNLTSITAQESVADESLLVDHLVQPHIYSYGCLGNNSRLIKGYFQTGEWDMAIEQSIAAAKNLNFGDSTVVCRFMNNLSHNKETVKCILADNGESMTPMEFLQYVRASQNTTTEGENNG